MKVVLTSFHGYSPWSGEVLLDAIRKGTPPTKIPGDFVLSYRLQMPDGGTHEVLLTSAVSAVPYYYYQGQGRFEHGPTVFEVVRRAGIAWTWNARAVNCLALFEHTLGADTLHRDVARVKPASRYVWSDGQLRVSHDTQVDEAFEEPEIGNLAEALEVTREVFAELVSGRQIGLSLSAGYDSRALLAMARADGVTPVLRTMGHDGATDVKVASAIARELGVEHDVVEVRAQDYLALGADIAAATSGVKSMAHWHTYLFAKAAGFPDGSLHLAGANGELARSYFFDKGALALLADQGPSGLAGRFLELKYGLRRKWPRSPVRSFFAEDVAGQCLADGLALASNACAGPSSFLRQLDWFYSMTRVRHFIGGGLASYQQFCPTASPFLDGRFVAAAAKLERRWKLNSRFHRALIGATCPRLLAFPVDESEISMADAERPFYWRQRSREVAYNPLSEVLAMPEVTAVVMESEYLDTFIARPHREALLRLGHRQLLCFLLTMHFAAGEAAKCSGRAQ